MRANLSLTLTDDPSAAPTYADGVKHKPWHGSLSLQASMSLRHTDNPLATPSYADGIKQQTIVWKP